MGIKLTQEIIEAAIEYQGLTKERVEYIENEDYDKSFDIECYLRELGNQLSDFILEQKRLQEEELILESVLNPTDNSSNRLIEELENDVIELSKDGSSNSESINRIRNKIDSLKSLNLKI